jgi:redox-sensitive bicupin YhaK (pirin superfamily)
MSRPAASGAGTVRIIEATCRNVDGATLRRALPAAEQPSVGPFILLDHFGPATLPPGAGLDVRPHPHIHLATISYLFEGEIVHRDDLGTCATLRPGDVGWMTAGRGIVHSERSSDAARAADASLHGLQIWLALPAAHEDTEPGYFHHLAASLPERTENGVRMRVLAGHLDEMRAPPPTFSPLLLAEVHARAGRSFAAPTAPTELAVYVVSGRVRIGGSIQETGHLIVLSPTERRIEVDADAHIVLVGGEPLEGRRHIWWNFVSSSAARIREAARDWREGRFGTVEGDDTFIPLPDEPPLPVD